ncbi:uncharacterized protein LOC142051239 [Phalacrocorax aristotelis]|uniref:uncharacterized protein LOC142051239 n=1 Tax=Phalacrocorax aristotelis TaxID=126867 RepID=UPI003F4B081D
MSQGEGAAGGYEKWDFDEGMGSGKGKRRDAINGGFPLDRAVVLLYVLLAVAYALFTALTVVNLRRASAAREASEQAQARSESGLATAWRNLSETRRTLDEQLSVDLKELHSQLLHVSEEVESAQRMVAQCRAECGSELSDRLRLLEERDALAPVLRRLAEVEQEQSRVEARLDAALEGGAEPLGDSLRDVSRRLAAVRQNLLFFLRRQAVVAGFPRVLRRLRRPPGHRQQRAGKQISGKSHHGQPGFLAGPDGHAPRRRLAVGGRHPPLCPVLEQR